MRVLVNGVRLFFEVAGEKLAADEGAMSERPTLLVLHGGPGLDHTIGAPHLRRFADVCQVICYDHRAQGRSEGWQDIESQTLAQWADDVRGLCDALDIVKPIVLGTSFGGLVAQTYGVRHPDHAAALVLNSTSGNFDLEEICAAFDLIEGADASAIARAAFTDASPENVRRYYERCMPAYYTNPAPPAALARVLRNDALTVRFVGPGGEAQGFNMLDQLGAIRCPTLVLAGRDDPICPPAAAARMAAAIGANAELHILDQCRHGVFLERPEIADPLLRAFIASVVAASGARGKAQ